VQLARGVTTDDEGTVIEFEEGGVMDLHDGEVFDNPVGANIQTADFDLDRLMNNVAWDNFGVEIDTRELYVPDLSNPFDD